MTVGSVTIAFANTANSVLHIQIAQNAAGGVPGSTYYCYEAKGASSPLTLRARDFTTSCWTPASPGTAWDGTNAVSLFFIIPGKPTITPFDACIENVTLTAATTGTGGTGGTTGAGGATSSGGAAGTGGATTAGGTPGTGATSSLPTSCTLAGTLSVAASSYVTDGTCAGYGYTFAYLSTAGGAGAVSISPCTDCTNPTYFTDTNKLCATGSVGPDPNFYNTDGIGFNFNQSISGAAGTMTPTGTGLQISFSATTMPAQLRVQIADSTTSTAVYYCFDISSATSPVRIPWSSFSTQCYVGAPAPKPFNPTTPIATVALVVPSASNVPRSFANLCLTGVSTY